MAACLEDDFESWLSLKLQQLNTDESVFSSYITSILSGEETVDEKTQALEEILTEITENDITTHCHEILERWKVSKSTDVSSNTSNPTVENMEEKLVRLMETNARSAPTLKAYTDDERKIRDAIIAQYSEVGETATQESDNDEVEESPDDALVKNTNASAVAQAEREKREQARLDNMKKKEKDKEDRERQKQQQKDKKEKRKTQKQERKR